MVLGKGIGGRVKQLAGGHIVKQVASQDWNPSKMAPGFISQTITLFYFFENQRRGKWNKPPGMRHRTEERSGPEVMKWKILETAPFWSDVVGLWCRSAACDSKSSCFPRKRKLILWFCVKRWLVSADKNPSLEEFLLLPTAGREILSQT